MGISMLKIRQSCDRLIFNMGIPILVRQHLYVETGMGISMLKIRQSWDRLIFNIGIPIMVKQHLYIEMVPWFLVFNGKKNHHFSQEKWQIMQIYFDVSLNNSIGKGWLDLIKACIQVISRVTVPFFKTYFHHGLSYLAWQGLIFLHTF